MIDSKQLMQQLQDFSDNGNIIIVDGDAIPFLIGWHHREHDDADLVRGAVDSWMKDLILLTNASAMAGFLGSSEEGSTYRANVYRYRKYKGQRPEKPDWIAKWQPVITQFLKEKYNFVEVPVWAEADDYVALTGHLCQTNGFNTIMCSPDKDLRQVEGFHLDYKHMDKKVEHVGSREATYNWCMQMLCGDTADNIAGVPKMGEKKADALLVETDFEMWRTAVKLKYQDYFGPNYGSWIHDETAATITLALPGSPIWESYKEELSNLSFMRHIQSTRT
jgi:5'-3' exonuclease, N-terminal resolvase-like domain